MKKKHGCLGTIVGFLLIALVVFFVLGWLFGDDEEEDYEFQSYSDSETEAASGNGGSLSSALQLNREDSDAKSATIMIYMIGSDLESDGGCATADIQEMCYADLGQNVNLVLQTGGAEKWNNKVMRSGQTERFVFQDGSPELQVDLGRKSMVQTDTVTDFIRWSAENYPADRYGLIFWNHGGGTIMGFGCDENDPDKMLTVSDIRKALTDAGVHFDFVGFDACLMGTVEMAYALSDSADYFLGAEETEPGTGWYYTGWLSSLGSNPGISMEVLGKQIIDDFVTRSNYYDETTLSLIRLDRIQDVYTSLCSYLLKSSDVLSGSYARISGARSAAKAFGENEYEQIDIISYVNAAGDIEGGETLRQAVKDAVVYTRGSVADANGLAMYYPYNQLDQYSSVMNMLGNIGYNDNGYVGYFNSFVSDLAYGHSVGGSISGSISAMEQLTGYTPAQSSFDFSGEDWYDADDSIDQNAVLSLDGTLQLTEKNGSYVVSLTKAQWDSIGYAEMQLYIDDGGGYLDMGTDTAISFTEDGDLSADFDFAWLSLDGEQNVPFFTIEDKVDSQGNWHAMGYVPATLNDDRDIEIICYWDSQTTEGVIKGYRYADEPGAGFRVPQRRLHQLKEGDVLFCYCSYYTYDGDFDAEYYVGDPITVPKNGLNLCYLEMADDTTAVIAFHLQDLYQNDYWTEALEIKN